MFLLFLENNFIVSSAWDLVRVLIESSLTNSFDGSRLIIIPLFFLEEYDILVSVLDLIGGNGGGGFLFAPTVLKLSVDFENCNETLFFFSTAVALVWCEIKSAKKESSVGFEFSK